MSSSALQRQFQKNSLPVIKVARDGEESQTQVQLLQKEKDERNKWRKVAFLLLLQRTSPPPPKIRCSRKQIHDSPPPQKKVAEIQVWTKPYPLRICCRICCKMGWDKCHIWSGAQQLHINGYLYELGSFRIISFSTAFVFMRTECFTRDVPESSLLKCDLRYFTWHKVVHELA